MTVMRRIAAAAAAACAMLVALCGCVPDDEIAQLDFSPDGRRLAWISDQKGLSVANLDSRQAAVLVPGHVCSPRFSWHPAGDRMACVSDADGNWDILLAGLDGQTTVVSRSLARQDCPMFLPNGDLVCITSGRGRAELFRWDARRSASERVLEMPGDIVEPVLSPDGNAVAFWHMDAMRPQVYVAYLPTGKVERLTSETEPVSLEPGSLAWSPDGRSLLAVRRLPLPRGSRAADQDSPDAPGAEVVLIAATVRGAVESLVRLADPQAPPFFDADGRFFYYHDKGTLWRRGVHGGRASRLPFEDFEVSCVCSGPSGGRIAFAADKQLLAMTANGLQKPRFLIFDLEDKFVLAEQFFRLGRMAESYGLYEELAASVSSAEDPGMARFFYVANLCRLGRTREAVSQLEDMLARREIPAGLQEARLWKMLGYSHLFALRDFSEARRCLDRHAALADLDEGADADDSAMAANALEILRRNDPRLARMYADAVKARLDGDFAATAKRFGALLQRYAHLDPVREEYLRALEGFEEEVYYFSLSRRPFKPSRAEQIGYLEPFIERAADSPLCDGVRLQLFQLYIESRQFAKARRLLAESLRAEGEHGVAEDVPDVFLDYLERPEATPWLPAAMREVFLHPAQRGELEQRLYSPQAHLLLHLAAAKLALSARQTDAARAEIDAALGRWQRIPPYLRGSADHELYARLLVMRAREAEMRGLHAEAASFLDQARDWLRSNKADAYELFLQIAFRAAMLRSLHAAHPDLLERLMEIDRLCGDEIVDPTWDRALLDDSLRRHMELYDDETKCPRACRPLIACRLGMVFVRMRMPGHARAAFLEVALDDGAPQYQREAAWLELGAIDENLGDPWNSARWYRQLAAAAGAGLYEKQWLSFKIAQQHLQMDHKTQEARDALSVLVSTVPDTPLATQAHELLNAYHE